jgi:protein O-GlcNAc transferase
MSQQLLNEVANFSGDGQAHYRRGNSLLAANALPEAVESYQRALALEPGNRRAHNNLGQALMRLGRRSEAIQCFENAVALDRRYAIAHNNLATARFDARQFEESWASCRAAIELNPSLTEAHFNGGNALCKLGRHAEALDCYERAILLRPGLVEAHVARGNALHALQRLEQALDSYRQAQRFNPAHTIAACNEAAVLMELGLLQEAVARCEQILQGKPDVTHALNICGGALRALGRHEDAARCFAQLKQVDPDFELALGRMLHARQNSCDWSEYERNVGEVDELITRGRNAANPFSVLSVLSSGRQLLRCAQIFACADGRTHGHRASLAGAYGNDRIRLAYLSGDLREHAVSYLMAGVLEQHDRERFETIALSLNPREASPMGTRVAASFEHFIDVSRMGDAQIGALIRQLRVDILVDLVGFTQFVRLGILAQHAATVQVNYLGHPGTMGAQYMDYILADRFLVPPANRAFYGEQVAYLPECFQANDDRRLIGAAPSRAEAGLPDQKFVFSAFGGSHKITPAIFSLWCRLLAAVPGSVLWLVADNEVARRNLMREAAVRGVDPERLVFADRQPYAQHLGRLGLSDLSLDTFPFNGGTTASDVLWAGVPLITCVGEAFASRMAGSLLHTLGLDNLVTDSLEDYERLALQLSSEPSRLQSLRSLLAQQRESAPLFQTERFCRHLEAAYRTMWQRAEAGLPAASFVVEASA